MRSPGRPSDPDLAVKLWRCRRQLLAAQRERAALQAGLTAREAQDGFSCVRLLLALLFYGASLRSAAACLKSAFGELAPEKSSIALWLEDLCAAAEELFNAYFAGRGTCGAGDEIYLSGHPILEVVDPLSLAITAIAAQAPTQENWERLLGCFAQLAAGVSDQGLGVSHAMAQCVERPALDKWHLLRPFAAAVGCLERHAYDRIADVEEKITVFVAALPFEPGKEIPRALVNLEDAQTKSEEAINRYDAANTVLGWLRETVCFLDSHGRVRTPSQIAADWEAALDLVQNIKSESLWKLADKLRGKVTGTYAEGLGERLNRVALPGGWKDEEQEELQRQACQAWSYHHQRQTHLLEGPVKAAQTLAGHWGLASAAPHLESFCTAVFRVLDSTLVASSAVECVNSLTRLREGAKRHPHPKFVFFLAWLHNTRTFTEGKRKGLTPAQILGVSLPKDGWTMLLERVLARRAARRTLDSSLN